MHCFCFTGQGTITVDMFTKSRVCTFKSKSLGLNLMEIMRSHHHPADLKSPIGLVLMSKLVFVLIVGLSIVIYTLNQFVYKMQM